MQRRHFLSSIAAAITGVALDPDLLTWRPGQRTYFDIKKPDLLSFDVETSFSYILVHLYGEERPAWHRLEGGKVLLGGWVDLAPLVPHFGTHTLPSKRRQDTPVGLHAPGIVQAPQPLTMPDSGIQRPSIVPGNGYARRSIGGDVPAMKNIALDINSVTFTLE